jgi:hypothetical protein
MPANIPGLAVLIFSGDVLNGLTVGDARAYAAEIVVVSGRMLIDIRFFTT